MAGRGRRQAGGGQSGRYVYTGSVDGGEPDCDICRCCSLFSFGLSSCAALCGIMLTVFGSTGFFRTNELNYALLIVGIVLLVAAAVLIALGFSKLLRINITGTARITLFFSFQSKSRRPSAKILNVPSINADHHLAWERHRDLLSITAYNYASTSLYGSWILVISIC